MIKSLILVTAALSSACVYAIDGKVITNPGNNPGLGSQQGSNQTFGNLPITGEPGQVFNASAPYSVGNIETVGSRQGSNQTFGNPPITGQKGETYHPPVDQSNRLNRPTVGAKSGSNQLFGTSPVKKKKNSSSTELVE